MANIFDFAADYRRGKQGLEQLGHSIAAAPHVFVKAVEKDASIVGHKLAAAPHAFVKAARKDIGLAEHTVANVRHVVTRTAEKDWRLTEHTVANVHHAVTRTAERDADIVGRRLAAAHQTLARTAGRGMRLYRRGVGIGKETVHALGVLGGQLKSAPINAAAGMYDEAMGDITGNGAYFADEQRRARKVQSNYGEDPGVYGNGFWGQLANSAAHQAYAPTIQAMGGGFARETAGALGTYAGGDTQGAWTQARHIGRNVARYTKEHPFEQAMNALTIAEPALRSLSVVEKIAWLDRAAEAAEASKNLERAAQYRAIAKGLRVAKNAVPNAAGRAAEAIGKRMKGVMPKGASKLVETVGGVVQRGARGLNNVRQKAGAATRRTMDAAPEPVKQLGRATIRITKQVGHGLNEANHFRNPLRRATRSDRALLGNIEGGGELDNEQPANTGSATQSGRSYGESEGSRWRYRRTISSGSKGSARRISSSESATIRQLRREKPFFHGNRRQRQQVVQNRSLDRNALGSRIDRRFGKDQSVIALSARTVDVLRPFLEDYTSDIHGFTQSNARARDMATYVDTLANDAERDGNTAEATELRQLARHTRSVAKSMKRRGVAFVSEDADDFEATSRHELVHSGQLEYFDTKRPLRKNFRRTVANPNYKKMYKWILEKKGRKLYKGTGLMEVPAFIASGEWRAAGLTEAQAQQLLRDYFYDMKQSYGSQAARKVLGHLHNQSLTNRQIGGPPAVLFDRSQIHDNSGSLTLPRDSKANLSLSSHQDVEAHKVGGHVVHGLVNSLKEQGGAAHHAGGHIAHHTLGGMTEGFDINSPSRETYAVGLDVGEGLRLGLIASTGKVTEAAQQLAAAANAALKKTALAGIADQKASMKQAADAVAAAAPSAGAASGAGASASAPAAAGSSSAIGGGDDGSSGGSGDGSDGTSDSSTQTQTGGKLSAWAQAGQQVQGSVADAVGSSVQAGIAAMMVGQPTPKGQKKQSPLSIMRNTLRDSLKNAAISGLSNVASGGATSLVNGAFGHLFGGGHGAQTGAGVGAGTGVGAALGANIGSHSPLLGGGAPNIAFTTAKALNLPGGGAGGAGALGRLSSGLGAGGFKNPLQQMALGGKGLGPLSSGLGSALGKKWSLAGGMSPSISPFSAAHTAGGGGGGLGLGNLGGLGGSGGGMGGLGSALGKASPWIAGGMMANKLLGDPVGKMFHIGVHNHGDTHIHNDADVDSMSQSIAQQVQRQIQSTFSGSLGF